MSDARIRTPCDVAVVTSSRADYGHTLPVVRALQSGTDVKPRLLVTGAHLSHEFGAAITAIEADGLPIDDRIDCLLSADTEHASAKTIGIATMGFADSFARRRPDVLVVVADRYEMLAPASAALAMRIPIAHIEGGDVSEGAIDQMVRNALTMMSHVHFAPTRTAAQRLRAMGEEVWRVHHAGTPSLDVLMSMTPEEIDSQLAAHDLDVADGTLVVGMHPVTLHHDSTDDAAALFEALIRVDRPIVFCFPNADAGGRRIGTLARAFADQRPNAHLVMNLPPRAYWSLLHRATALVGNSSSGIMEAPALKRPSVNIGDRQAGRERAASVIDSPADADAIVAAIERACSEGFRRSLAEMTHPYGDGRSGPRIASIIAGLTLDEHLLRKPAIPIVGP